MKILQYFTHPASPDVAEFPEQTLVFAKGQPEYLPLPAHRDSMGRVTFCWKLNFGARLKLLFTGKLWHQVLTFNDRLQPQLMLLTKPAMKSNHGLS